VGGTEGEDTFCPKCKAKVIDRSGYVITAIHVAGGRCAFCGNRIEGVWNNNSENRSQSTENRETGK